MRALSGAALAAALIISAPSVQAQDTRPTDLRAKDAVHDCRNLGELIALVGERTQKVFLFSERVRGVKIHMEGRSAIAEDALYDVFQSILELNGFALATIARGTPAEVIKVVDARSMRSYPAQSFSAEDLRAGTAQLPNAEEMVTVTYKLRSSRARIVSNAMRPLLDPNKGGQIIGIDGAEVIVLSDYAPNVSRLIRVIAIMDQPSPDSETAEVVDCKHGNGVELAALVNGLKPEQGGWVRARALSTGGAIALVGPARQVTLARALIENLDRPTPGEKK